MEDKKIKKAFQNFSKTNSTKALAEIFNALGDCQVKKVSWFYSDGSEISFDCTKHEKLLAFKKSLKGK